MNSKRVKVFVLCITFLFLNIGEIFAATSNSQKVKNVEMQRKEIRQKINALSKLEMNKTNELSRNQQKLEKNQKALQESKQEFNKKQSNIISLQKELDSYLAEYNKRNKQTAERIRCIYKNQHSIILDLFLSTSGITEFLDRVYYQNLIIQSDKRKMSNLRDEARRIAVMKHRLENEKRQLSGIIKVMDKENYTIQTTIKQNKNMIEKIQKDKKAYERSERELKRLSDRLTSIINNSTARSNVVAGSGFLRPVAGARVTSPYGWRVHPIFKTRIFHTGLDLAAPIGTPIKASNSGKVIYSGWYGGYGKVVILDHGSCTGKPTTTLYAHMSRQNVSVGQYVQRGQVIGYVGSTGYSTGPHCHFEVRINGHHQNPNKYL